MTWLSPILPKGTVLMFFLLEIFVWAQTCICFILLIYNDAIHVFCTSVFSLYVLDVFPHENMEIPFIVLMSLKYLFAKSTIIYLLSPLFMSM